MARATRQLVPSTGTSTQTLTLTLDTPSSSSLLSQQQQQQKETLVLKLKPKPKKRVTWTEDTVDNEFLNKKSSKKCCIFHKEKPFDEDDSDDEGFDGSPNGDLSKNHDHNCHHSNGDACDGAGTSHS